jgi:hypothetical protein
MADSPDRPKDDGKLVVMDELDKHGSRAIAYMLATGERSYAHSTAIDFANRWARNYPNTEDRFRVALGHFLLVGNPKPRFRCQVKGRKISMTKARKLSAAARMLSRRRRRLG